MCVSTFATNSSVAKKTGVISEYFSLFFPGICYDESDIGGEIVVGLERGRI